MAALAFFKQSQADVTPRTAIQQFIDANESEAQTPALFFEKNPSKEGLRKRKATDNEESSPKEASPTVVDDFDDVENSNISSDNSDLQVRRSLRRSSRGRKSAGVTQDQCVKRIFLEHFGII